MSIIRLYTLFCDAEDCEEELDAHCNSVRYARELAALQGWGRQLPRRAPNGEAVDDGKDYCPVHKALAVSA